MVARGTHSLHLERGFDTLKRNLSLESRSNIKLSLRFVCEGFVIMIEPIIPRHLFIIIIVIFF